MENLRWIAAAALSAFACHLAVHHATPIDHALPLLAVVVTFLAWRSYPAVMLAVPLLILAELAIPEETMRLLAFGVVVASAFGMALCGGDLTLPGNWDSVSGRPSGAVGLSPPGTGDTFAESPAGTGDKPPECPVGSSPPLHRTTSQGEIVSASRLSVSAVNGLAMTCLALLVLRWIPFENVRIGRELLLLAIAVATVSVLGCTPFAVAVAVITALATPAVPLRTLALPLLVLLVATVARLFGMPRVHLTWASTIALVFVMLFFPWSGIVARAFPYFLRKAMPPAERTIVAQALPPNRSMIYDVPHGARSVVLSGANVAHLRRGALLGRIEPGGIAVRIGDAADWGYMRRDHFYGAHNPLPRDAAGKIRDYGYLAWVDGAGRVPLPRGARTIRVTAAASLPENASLQVEGFE